MLKKLFLFLLVMVLILCFSAGGAFYWFVVLNPGEEIAPENIKKILGKESPVFYDDGVTRLGVFFDQAHRQYIPYEQIPVDFINALVASEDNRFFSHFGFDVPGILRAFMKNIEAGKIVQGGSTLTQQTAKNLFKREGRSFRSKLKELVLALRLEYHYPKEKIFEFYANQFYVSGNGHGLGVAARYYFDKDPQELNLLQCAYIAGSVKRPNAYNSFIKKDQESVARALENGRQRVNYVLTKMLELGMISQYQYGVAKLSEIGFQKGTVGYSLDYVLETVKDAVSLTEVIEALEKYDIDNISTSGVRIITTVNKELQENTLYALRRELSRLDVRLRGYEHDEVQAELTKIDYLGDTEVQERAFLFGSIKKVSTGGDAPQIEVELAHNNGSAVIDENGIARLVKARVHWLKNPWSEAGRQDYREFLQQLQEGDKVWVSVREKNEDGRVFVDLEKFPLLNGGALVIKDGTIKAMAGGVENRFYNRAIHARRTMGSSFKPFVYAAALQLGWNSADLLKNRRDLFVFHNKAYFPRPDHDSPFDEVSMSWAGALSENLASVWLLAHLCDKLNMEQFKEVAAKADMLPRVVEGEEEPYSSYRTRIRDVYGIVVNNDMLRQAAFGIAVKNIETDLIFEGRDREYARLQEMHYGLNFNKFYNEIASDLDEEEKKLTAAMRTELVLRRTILDDNFLHLERLRNEFSNYIERITATDPYSSPTTSSMAGMSQASSPGEGMGGQLFFDRGLQRYYFTDEKATSVSLTPVDRQRLRTFLFSRSDSEKQSFLEEVTLNAAVTVSTFDLLKRQIDIEMEVLKGRLPYSIEVLATIDDFRIFVGLKYLIALARELGVGSELQPVLSFPLGSNVVTLFEALRIYEALVTGDVVLPGSSKDENRDLLAIIDRIESAEGDVLYRPQQREKRLFDPQTTVAVGHILENTIKFGTGRYADANIKLTDDDEQEKGPDLGKQEWSIPVLGKTGTANRYTNASFFGYLPGLSPSGDTLVADNGYAVGVYVGFDDNRVMRKGATRITGSAGALPTWTEIVNGIVSKDRYAEHLDAVDLSFYGLQVQHPDVGQKNFGVDPENGGVVYRQAKIVSTGARYQPSILTFGHIAIDGSFTPARYFSPYWKAAVATPHSLNNENIAQD